MKKNSDFDGIIVVNKPSGCTSRDVVDKLIHKFNTKKIGHTGTLDPLASGVLVCTIGKCTKLCNFLTSSFKEYRVEFILGHETDTLDITGKTTKKSEFKVSDNEIRSVIENFVCTYEQEVPLYSAVKVNGKKLYEYARENRVIALPKKSVTVKYIENIKINKNIITFDCKVSKGTYIRSLVRDIGRKLNTYATMSNLIRTSQGNFNIKDAYTIEDIENDKYKVLTKEEVLKDIYSIEIDEALYKKVSNGAKVPLSIRDEYVTFKKNGKIICLYKKDGDIYRPYIMF